MLIDFSVQNFLSFKEEATFSMLAANSVREHEAISQDNARNIISFDDTSHRLLKTAVIYGANSSGKSNLVSAFHFFKTMIINSFRDDNILSKFHENIFLFDKKSATKPSFFEMTFLVDNARYRYGFKIIDRSILAEWLYVADGFYGRERYCFKRENKEITINSRTFPGTRGLRDRTRHNALFLSTCAQFNVNVSMIIKEWFRKKLYIISDFDAHPFSLSTAIKFLNDSDIRNKIVEFVKLIDTGILDIKVEERVVDKQNIGMELNKKKGAINFVLQPSKDKNEVVKSIDVLIAHNRFEDGEPVDTIYTPFNMESLGTRKIFSLLGPWLQKLVEGGVLIIDEFCSSIHSSLAIELLKLFHSARNDKSQLVVATHDTTLLRRELLRRDQIWFTEKDREGGSHLFALVEYKINKAASVRNDANYGADYLRGKYGAIPYFGDISKFAADYLSANK